MLSLKLVAKFFLNFAHVGFSELQPSCGTLDIFRLAVLASNAPAPPAAKQTNRR